MNAAGTKWPAAGSSSRSSQRNATTGRRANNVAPRASRAGTPAKDPSTPMNPRRARLLRILFDPAEGECDATNSAI